MLIFRLSLQPLFRSIIFSCCFGLFTVARHGYRIHISNGNEILRRECASETEGETEKRLACRSLASIVIKHERSTNRIKNEINTAPSKLQSAAIKINSRKQKTSLIRFIFRLPLSGCGASRPRRFCSRINQIRNAEIERRSLSKYDARFFNLAAFCRRLSVRRSQCNEEEKINRKEKLHCNTASGAMHEKKREKEN